MYRSIRVPRKLSSSPISIDTISVQIGSRVRQQQILANLHTPNEQIPIIAPSDGWIKLIAVKENSQIKGGDLLFTLDIMATEDFQASHEEVNNSTELGNAGRRGVEREGQQKFVEAYAATLFESSDAQNGQHAQASATKAHPLMANAKEGVPHKMSSHVADNATAVERFVEEASNDPELRKQLGNQLQQQLNIQSTPSAAPTLKVS